MQTRPAHSLDLSRRLLPEALARTAPLAFLSTSEHRVLNQLRGRTYLAVTTFTTALQLRAFPIVGAPTARRVLALVRPLALELAARLGLGLPRFDRDDHVAMELLAGSPLALALTAAYLGWAVQVHHAEATADGELDPGFRGLLAAQWLAQAEQVRRFARHARALATALDPEGLAAAIASCVAGARRIDALLADSLDEDLEALGAHTGRRLGERERARARIVQHQAARWTHLGAGLTHPSFVHLVRELAGEHAHPLAALGEAFL